MDFQNVNPLNVRLNKLSGNLFPMTDDDKVFPAGWRIYSVVVLLIEVIQITTIIIGMISVPKDKALKDATVSTVVSFEILFLYARMYARRNLMSQLIRKLNVVLRVDDEAMRDIVGSTIKSVEIPLKFHGITGFMAILLWYGTSFAAIINRMEFFYVDYRIPSVFSRQPFSKGVFMLGECFGCISALCVFVRKSALDFYTINILLLITAQYRYTAMKLAAIFREESPQNQHEVTRKRSCCSVNLLAETELKALCRHHNTVVQMTPILTKLLSVNFSLIYLSNVFRFCFLGIMIMLAVSSSAFEEAVFVFLYMIGGLVQLYILCSCAHHLLEASTETTDKAFHEKWYRFGPALKNLFLLMTIGNNLECKISTFEMFSLSLPSFMTILNQSYSIALLFLRTK